VARGGPYASRFAALGIWSAIALAACWPASAGASTQLGQLPPPGATVLGCGTGLNTVQRGVSSGAPYFVPAGGGVITSWQHFGGLTVGSGRLLAWRPAGGTSLTLAGRSDLESFSAGVVTTFATRIPVSGGELLGLRVQTEATCLFDASGPANLYSNNGLGAPDPAPGETQNLNMSTMGERINVSATLEPDADGDGFGDETQDQCPGEAGTQNGCVPDTSPPDTQITKGPKNKTKKKQATFEFSASEAGATFECSLDSAAFAPCASPFTLKVKKGKHTFGVRAADAAGNVDFAPATDDWKVKKKKHG
jgi:hypothetical protein